MGRFLLELLLVFQFTIIQKSNQTTKSGKKEVKMQRMKNAVAILVILPLLLLFLLLIAIGAFVEGLVMFLILVIGAIRYKTWPNLRNPMGPNEEK